MKKQIEDAINETKGKFFVIRFTKKDGSDRLMVCRVGVKGYKDEKGERKELTGKGMSWKPSSRGMRVVWDLQKKEYRLVNLNTAYYFKCGSELVGGKLRAGSPS